jgi:hypothetical protein
MSDPMCRTVLLAAICLITTAGCHRVRSAGNEHGQGDEHGGHVIPSHKPKTFPDAVVRLRELSREIQTRVSQGKTRALNDDKTLSIALDIANWLPEIAADSDMPEGPWNAVNDRSRTLVVDYQVLLDIAATGIAAGESSRVLSEADRTVSELEAILAKSDPRWFDGTVKRPASP